MAAVRARGGQAAVGSSPWVQDENAQVSQFCAQEAEDFAFSARNEVDWLNEHMADIFTKDQVSVTDVFKTPGKLRGKTPRTARKMNALEHREPLSEIFSATKNRVQGAFNGSPEKRSNTPKFSIHQVGRDFQAIPNQSTISVVKEPKDSGYHGMSEDEVETDRQLVQHREEEYLSRGDRLEVDATIKEISEPQTRSNSEGSFKSAREELTRRDILPPTGLSHEVSHDVEANVQELAATVHEEQEDLVTNERLDHDLADDDSPTSSQRSSPAKTLLRKSSLTFAALPAREPITTKKSIGARTSQTGQIDRASGATVRGGLLDRLTGGKSLGGLRYTGYTDSDRHDEVEAETNDASYSQSNQQESDASSRMTQLHNKSSTQRLHDRINLLGKSQAARPIRAITKDISSQQSQQPDQPQMSLPHSQTQVTVPEVVAEKGDDEDDWIQPPQHDDKLTKLHTENTGKQSDSMHNGHTKVLDRPLPSAWMNQQSHKLGSKPVHNLSHEASLINRDSVMPEVIEANKALRILEAKEHGSHTESGDAKDSATPINSPVAKRHIDGPLSASKSKLQTVMQTARGLFSSSAGVSAQAKMETMSGSEPAFDEQIIARAPLSPQRPEKSQTLTQTSRETAAPPSQPEQRQTRSSTERLKSRAEEAAQEGNWSVIPDVHEEQLVAQAERKPADEPRSHSIAKVAEMSPRKPDNGKTNETDADEMQEPAIATTSSHTMPRPSQVHRPKDPRRPVKPAKDTAPRPKAPPVNIRVGMPSQRLPLTNAALSSTLQDSLASGPATRRVIVKKASTTSLQSSMSTNNPKNSAAVSKPKALLAAERKKELDEREAQRKADQRRELERKRAAQQEETRRHEEAQRREAERQREKDRTAAVAEESRRNAQRQAIEKRRLEMQKKEQRANNASHTGQGPGHTGRADLGGARPPSRQQTVPDHHHRPNTNGHAANVAKTQIKRVLDPDNDEAAAARIQRPQGTTGAPYQASNAKRRKTDEDELEEFPIRPTMAPPIRQSGIRKEAPKPTMFSSNYTVAPAPQAAHTHAPSLLKATTSHQAYQQNAYQAQHARQGYQPDTSKYRDGNRIPFADNANAANHPAAAATAPPPQPFKTPLPSRLAQAGSTNTRHNSPQYTNGENIQLAEIPTDSEDSDSSPDTAQKRQKAASLPEWAQSPNLRELLEQQEDLLDADAVFGPVASPRMEEMFRERHHRFRSRTSSANWAGQDRLTEEEIRRDVEARARMRKDGGWSFGL